MKKSVSYEKDVHSCLSTLHRAVVYLGKASKQGFWPECSILELTIEISFCPSLKSQRHTVYTHSLINNGVEKVYEQKANQICCSN